MQITDVEPIALRLPEVDASRAGGTHDAFPGRIHTDAGVVGLGEADTSPYVARTIVEDAIVALAGPGRAGAPRRPGSARHPGAAGAPTRRHRSLRPGGAALHVLSAIDMALWDLAGKLAGEPVHRLPGSTSPPTVVRVYASAR